MQTGRTDFEVRLLGPPSLSVAGSTVSFPTRKSNALCFLLIATSPRRWDRTQLSAMLWGESEAEHARGSLRKALSLLSSRGEVGSIIGRDRNSAWSEADISRSDLAAFNRCLKAASEQDYVDALALWRGEPLADLEIGEEGFDEWVFAFRNSMVASTHTLLSQRLAALPDDTSTRSLVIALSQLITRIEPSDCGANDRLIRAHAARGDVAAAMVQYRSYVRALVDLNVPVPPEMAKFAASLAQSGRKPQDTAADVSAGDLATSRRKLGAGPGWPRVAILRPLSMRPIPDLLSFTHEEVMLQLTRFRSLRCFDAPSDEEERPSGARQIKLYEDFTHDYRITMTAEPRARAIYVKCTNTHTGELVSYTKLDEDVLADRQNAEQSIASAINAIHEDILSSHFYQPEAQASPFRRWLQAYKLMQEFTLEADNEALTILESLANHPKGKSLSLVHSSISSSLLKRRLLNPSSLNDAAEFGRALDAARHALALDSLEPFNHVVSAWAHMQTNNHARALDAFDTALRLNPYSSRMLMSASQGNAYGGNLRRARELSDRAMALSNRWIPPYFHSYNARLAFLEGSLVECQSHLERAPDNIENAILSTIVATELGRKSDASCAKDAMMRRVQSTAPQLMNDTNQFASWISTTSMIKDPLQRRRFLSGLERAGVPLTGVPS